MATLAIVAVAGAGAWGATAVGISAAAGWTLGSLVGSLLFAKGGGGSDQVGPRLENLKVTSATRGTPIKRVYGTTRVGGNLMWTGGLIETKHEDEAGKGGSETVDVIWYTYSASFSVALCEGPITGVRRIWADAKLIYDIGSAASATQVLVSKTAGYTIYDGDETQLPSALTQATYSTDSVPGSRGIAYIEFNEMQLEEYGNRIPNITAEVVSAGDITWSFQAFDIPEEFFRNWDNGAMDAMHYWDGVTGYYVRAPYTDNNHTELTISEYRVGADAAPIKVSSQVFPTKKANNVEWPVFNGRSNSNKYIFCQYKYAAPATHRILRLRVFDSGTDDDTAVTLGEWPIGAYSDLSWAIWDDLVVVCGYNVTTGSDPYVMYQDTGGVMPFDGTLQYPPNAVELLKDTGIDVVADQLHASSFPGVSATRLSSDFLFIMAVTDGIWLEILKYDKITFQILDTFVLNEQYLSFEIVNSDDVILAFGSNLRIYKNFSSTSYEEIVTPGPPTGTEPSASDQYKHNVIMSSDYSSYAFWYSYWAHDSILSVGYQDLSSDAVTLASVITAICEDAGLTAADIDVSTLSDTVTGYPIGRQEKAANSLDPLLTAYSVTTAESDWKIVFLKAADVTAEAIDVEEFGATVKNRANELVATRMMDSDLPRRINVQYSNFDTDYQTAVQRAQRIIN